MRTMLVALALGLTLGGSTLAAPTLAQPVALPWSLRLPGRVTDYEVTRADGRWGREYLLTTQAVSAEGWRHLHTRGRSANVDKPFSIFTHRATRQGVAVMLAYSGNHLIELRPAGEESELLVRCSPAAAANIGQLGDLSVPGALVSRFTGDLDDATLPIRRYIRAHLRRDMGPDWPPVQYNDWYYHSGAMSEASLLRCAGAAREVGCELFTVDAGWYGSRPDWQYLGEWTENKERFPDGFARVADGVRALGLRFGMWVEIESVHHELPLAKAHPDWFLRGLGVGDGGRLVLNLGHPEAYAHAQAVLDRMITTYRLDYLKMDFNTDCSRGSEGYTDGQDPLLGHYRGLIALWRHLRETYPSLIVENCASGSLRQDAMTAALTDTHWISDEVANHLNLALNYGATAFFPAEIGSHWTTAPEDERHRDWFDVAARFRANFTGHFGLSGDIAGWQPETRAVLARELAWYKQFRGHLCRADVYHLTPPPSYDRPAPPTALQYLDPENQRSVLLAFRGDGEPRLTVRPRGLAPELTYRVTGAGPERMMTGRQLGEAGLTIEWTRPGESACIEIAPAK